MHSLPYESPEMVVQSYIKTYDKWESRALETGRTEAVFDEQQSRAIEWNELHELYCVNPPPLCMVTSPGLHAAKEDVVEVENNGTRSKVRTRTDGSLNGFDEWVYELEMVEGRWKFTRITSYWDDSPDDPFVWVGDEPEDDASGNQ